MALDRQTYTPISILAGATIIALGLFFGLRARDPAPPDERAPASNQASDLRSPPPPVGSVDLAAARRSAERALEAQRTAVVDRCIPPEARGGGPSRLHINITFDKSGNQIARGIIPERDDPRRELSICATSALTALTIPPQEAPAALDLIWSLP